MRHSKSGYIVKDKETNKHYIAYHKDQLPELRAIGKAMLLPVNETFQPMPGEQKLVVKQADRLTVVGLTD